MRKDNTRINDEITSLNVRLVGKNVENNVIKLSDALHLAEAMGLDLIEINSSVNPSICKIEDYNKHLYELKKKKKEMDKKNRQNQCEMKELRFTPNTDDHDFNFKLKHAQGFLKDGNKVKAFVFFKGREITFKDRGEILLLKFADQLSEYGIVESLPKLEGNKMNLIIKPKK